MDWENILSQYKNYLKIERSLSKNSILGYIQDIDALINYLKIDKKNNSPKEITQDQVKSFIYAQAKTKSPQSMARRISGLKSFFNYINHEGIRIDDPTNHLETPKLSRKLPEILSITEIEKILLSIDLSESNGQRNRAIIETLYGAGLRVSELITLTISNLYFKEKIIKVIGKGNKQRLVPMGEYVKKHIQIYIENNRKISKIDPLYSDTLFLNRNGKQLSREMIFILVRNFSKNAGITKKISPHTLRHSFATHLLENGADLRSIQIMMGHESITTTEIYAHMDSKYLKTIIDNFHPRRKR
tara:strand:- start:5035 stop:5937 length:903 start_codon:yes stop_codon:yes gene_type:complete